MSGGEESAEPAQGSEQMDPHLLGAEALQIGRLGAVPRSWVRGKGRAGPRPAEGPEPAVGLASGVRGRPPGRGLDGRGAAGQRGRFQVGGSGWRLPGGLDPVRQHQAGVRAGSGGVRAASRTEAAPAAHPAATSFRLRCTSQGITGGRGTGLPPLLQAGSAAPSLSPWGRVPAAAREQRGALPARTRQGAGGRLGQPWSRVLGRGLQTPALLCRAGREGQRRVSERIVRGTATPSLTADGKMRSARRQALNEN